MPYSPVKFTRGFHCLQGCLNPLGDAIFPDEVYWGLPGDQCLQGCLNPLRDAIFPDEVYSGLRHPTGVDMPEQGSPLKVDFPARVYIHFIMHHIYRVQHNNYAMKHNYCDYMQISNMNNTSDQLNTHVHL